MSLLCTEQTMTTSHSVNYILDTDWNHLKLKITQSPLI